MQYNLIDHKRIMMIKETSLRLKDIHRAESRCIIFTSKSMKWVLIQVMKTSELLSFIKWLKQLNSFWELFQTRLHIWDFGHYHLHMVNLLRCSLTLHLTIQYLKVWKSSQKQGSFLQLFWVSSLGQRFGLSHLLFWCVWIVLNAFYIAFDSIGWSFKTSFSRDKVMYLNLWILNKHWTKWNLIDF